MSWLTFSNMSKFKVEKHYNTSEGNTEYDRNSMGILCRVHNNLDNNIK